MNRTAVTKIDNILIILLSFLGSLSLTWNPYSNLNVFHFFAFFALFYLLLYFFWHKIKHYELNHKEEIIPKKAFVIYSVIILIPIIIGIFAYYPGFGSMDTIEQWSQVQSNKYDNWHPVLHTLFSLKLPSLFYNDYISGTIFQSIIIFFILIYFSYFLNKYFLNWKCTAIIIFLITFNPTFIKYTVTLMKDVPYSWSIFICTLFLIEISITDGKWLKSLSHKIAFILSSIGVLIFRHNGIAPFIIIFLVMTLFYPKFRKFLILSFCVIMSSFLLITGPVYRSYNVNMLNGGKAEMMGLVMGQLSTYFNSGIHFSKEELEVLNNVSSLVTWYKYYNPINFNEIKFNTDFFYWNLTQNADEVWDIYIRKSIENPDYFIKSYLNMSSPIWKIKQYYNDVDYFDNSINNLKIYCNIKDISNTVSNYLVIYNRIVTKIPFRLLFANFGDSFILIFFAFALTIAKTKFNFRRIIPFLLVMTNTIIIMLMITGEEYRYVYSQLICSVPLIIYSLFDFNKIGDKYYEKK